MALHQKSKRQIAAKLRRSGLEVKPQSLWSKFDLLINGAIRVSLKSSAPHQYRHAVTSRGRRYVYQYLTWHFNFHRHGRMPEHCVDFIICVACADGEIKKVNYFIIPWGAISGKTFTFHRACSPYSGRYAIYRNNWEPLLKMAEQQTATTTA